MLYMPIQIDETEKDKAAFPRQDQNLVISCCYFSENYKNVLKVYQDGYSSCKTIVLLIEPLVTLQNVSGNLSRHFILSEVLGHFQNLSASATRAFSVSTRQC